MPSKSDKDQENKKKIKDELEGCLQESKTLKSKRRKVLEAVGDKSKNQDGQQRAMNAKDPEGKKKGGGNWRHDD